ncbi:peptidase S8/S53 domain-containing protein [Nemania abortiva]|nr:peptidase S8/S53 domain-containing protein [Nemania abortiva]
MGEDEGKIFMAGLLTSVNSMGKSPYQLRLGYRANNTNEKEHAFRNEMKSDIFNYIVDISAVRTALYGTEEKELFLDMSDFSRPSHNFQDFISDLTDDLSLSDDEDDFSPEMPMNPAGKDGKRGTGISSLNADLSHSTHSNDKATFTKDREQQKSSPRAGTKLQTGVISSKAAPPHNAITQDTSSDRDVIGFEDILFYVCLPDMNFFKEAPQCEIRRLFKWLELGGVKTIRHLSIPDSATNPLCDIIVHHYITKRFSIERFDWRKLDINLEILTVGTSNEFTELTLYSSGNWGVLYHWASKEGLVILRKLKLVIINIVQLHPSTYEKARHRHKKLSKEYEKAFRERINELKPSFKLEINIEQKWDYPVVRTPESKEPFVPNLQLLDQLDPCHKLIYDLCNSNAYGTSKDRERVPAGRPPGVAGKGGQAIYQQKLKDLTLAPSLENRDSRIKVAILDNGADRIRSSIRGQIAKGVSYVTGGPASSRILPWWMVSDPHGTQMASLVAKANPFCRLYIARVGRGRKDILPKHAAEAIDWAIKQNVDIISISWVMKKDHPELKNAISRAVKGEGRGGRPTLVFCSTADEGVYSGTIYPASYDGVVNVAATDQYGHMTPASANGVDILVPGENITADGPSYMEKYSNSRVSGSSVATATAAGIASLALLLLRTYNWSRSERREEAEMMRQFYTRDGILGVFDKMNAHKAAVVPSKLFSGDMKELAEAWNYKGFKLRNPSALGNEK